MRIGIVNDMRLAVEALRRVVTGAPGYTVAWVAYDGAEAVAKCAQDTPDLVLMDLIMPVMDGVRATAEIMRRSPCAVLVVTATVEGHAAKVFEAMGCGALDAVATPVLGPDGKIQGGEALLAKIANLARLTGRREASEPPVRPAARLAFEAPGTAPLVAIGASTGGPKALADVLGAAPADLGAGIVVIQHVDVQFAGGLADWLGSQCRLPVRLAVEGGEVVCNQILLAASNDHLALGADRRLHYTADPKECAYRPSVDAFFRSALKYWPRRDLAILLTGMGRDGAAGLLELRRAGWHTIAQDERSSVLYGMPKAAAEIGAAVEILPPDRIREAIIQFARQARV